MNRKQISIIGITKFCFFLITILTQLAAAKVDRVVDIDYSKFSMEQPYISINFRTFDQSGKFLKNLRKDDLQLRVNGVLRDDYSLRRDFSSDEWLLVAAVVDISGSMKGKPMVDEKKALKNFALNLGKFDKIALLTFNQMSSYVVPFTRDKTTFIKETGRIVAKGDTALYNALELALEKTNETLAPRKAVVLFSDGKNTAGKLKYGALLKKIETIKIPIFTIGLGKTNRDVLSRIASLSGGKYFLSPTSSELLDVYYRIGENLKNIHVIDRLKLYGINKKNLFRIEITNRRTGSRIIYNLIPAVSMLGKKRELIDYPPGDISSPFSIRNLKRIAQGRNIYITLLLIVFIIFLIVLTWVLFRGKFLVIKMLITFFWIIFYFILQFIVSML